MSNEQRIPGVSFLDKVAEDQDIPIIAKNCFALVKEEPLWVVDPYNLVECVYRYDEYLWAEEVGDSQPENLPDWLDAKYTFIIRLKNGNQFKRVSCGNRTHDLPEFVELITLVHIAEHHTAEIFRVKPCYY